MGSALLSQWVDGPEKITALNPSPRDVPDGVTLLSSPDELGDERFDCIIAAVKPQMFDEVMPKYAARLAPGGYVISIAAGYGAARLSAIMGDAPVVRVMPNMPSAIGQGVSSLFAAPGVTAEQAAHAKALMQRAGSVIVVENEDRLDRATTVAGSGPGYVFEIARAYVDAATAQGFTEAEARDMVLHTMAGTVAMAIAQPDTSLEDLRDAVTSKGGTTAAGLQALNGDGELTRRMHATLQACYDRAVELR